MQINSYLNMNRSKSTYRSRMTQRTSTALLITKTTRDAITTYRVVDVLPLSCTEIAILHHETFNFLSDRKYFSQQSLNSGHQDITKSICNYARLSFLKKMYLPSTLLPSIHFCSRPYMLRLYDGKHQTYGKMHCIFAGNQCHIYQFHKLTKRQNRLQYVCVFIRICYISICRFPESMFNEYTLNIECIVYSLCIGVHKILDHIHSYRSR